MLNNFLESHGSPLGTSVDNLHSQCRSSGGVKLLVPPVSIKAVNYARKHCVLLLLICIFKDGPVEVKIPLMKQKKKTVINFWPLSVTFFWHCMWKLESHVLTILVTSGHLRQKHSPVTDGVGLNSPVSFMEHHFHFKECMTDKLEVIYTWACGIFHTKMNDVNLGTSWKEMTKFVTNNKAKIKILENYIYHCELDSFTILSPEEIDDNINVYGFWNCIMKCINIWKTGITQWTSVFQITNVWC